MVTLDGARAELALRCQVASLLEVVDGLDANGDGTVDARDSTQILQLDGGSQVGSACETWAADVDGDGDYDGDDLMMLQGIVEMTGTGACAL